LVVVKVVKSVLFLNQCEINLRGKYMPYSKYNDQLEFSEDEWVVSLINTKSDYSGVLGGHAKIVVEGVRRVPISGQTGMFATEKFIGEYHIMDSGQVQEEQWNTWVPEVLRNRVPQVLMNTKSTYLVAYKETNEYFLSDDKLKAVQSRSRGGLKQQEVMKMIQNIKQEQQDVNEGRNSANFQYAGNWCWSNYKGGHNCTTWAEEKLNIIGIGQYLVTDSSKASPYLHVNSGCAIS
jgi:hypothetical protein